jgi:hypothetical protein
MQSWLVWSGLLTLLTLFVAARLYFARLRRYRRGDLYAIVTPEEAATEPYPYVHVEADGEVRELHSAERTHLEEYFHPCDGGLPYVKWRYRQKNGWGELSGYLRRSKLSRRVKVRSALAELPRKSLAELMRERGLDVTENNEGSFMARNSNRLFPR